MTKKRHRYVGYEGTCMDCNLDLDDKIHITPKEADATYREKMARRIIDRVRGALGVMEGIPGERESEIIGWDEALEAVKGAL